MAIDNNKLKRAMNGLKENQVYTQDNNIKNSKVPRPPKKGELMHCQWCGRVMRPKDFSSDPIKRKKEFKWQIHWGCRVQMLNSLDYNTPGLVAERHEVLKLVNEYEAKKRIEELEKYKKESRK